VEVAREIGRAGPAFSTHNWRAAAAGNLGGWQVARALFFLNVLTGSVGTPGGTSANIWDKFVPRPFAEPPRQKVWNELTWPREYPLAYHEMSFLLPHFLKEGRGKLDVYFTRVYNPVWTNPDGFTWMEVLTDDAKVGLHACLTPVWSETAWFADYVLPMGVGAERHDTHSYETHAGQWIGFRQPVVRVAMERLGRSVERTYEANPGEVWEENEFWIELSWRIDPDGSLGIRKFYESPYRPGERVTVDEYYRWMFEHSVPGLPEAAAVEGLTALQFMRKYGVFEVASEIYRPFEQPVDSARLADAEIDRVTHQIWSRAPAQPPVNAVPRPAVPPSDRGVPIGVNVDGQAYVGFPTPSGKLEFYSKTLKDWGWPEYAIPSNVKSHVHQDEMTAPNDFALIPTFRLPTLIHTRSGNAKWLNEISHSNPVWLNPDDAERLGFRTDDLIKVNTEIGYYVGKVWVTEGIRPGVIACSHHMGRWRLQEHSGGERWSTGLADLGHADDAWNLRLTQGVRPFQSSDPDSERIWWTDCGVHQNLTFAVHPDPVSGQHSWHQKVRLEHATPTDHYGDVRVDTAKAHEVYRRWLAMTRPAPGPGGLRRPPWMLRPYKPDISVYRIPEQT
jgi:anaerobic selenocysteine-containing dehydrogenase